MIGYKKGVRIVSISYPVFRSWLTLAMDKTTAPHRLLILNPHGYRYSNDVGVIVFYLRKCYKPPSLELEDKISITPFDRFLRQISTKC